MKEAFAGARLLSPTGAAKQQRTSQGRRFFALDALRGLAALAVVLFHVQTAFDRSPVRWMPAALHSVLMTGRLGVDAFFVLSGFVIAYSVRDGAWTLSYLGRFGLKRSLRLDPPYWAAIALEITLIVLGRMASSTHSALPTRGQILAHLFYLQGLLHYRQILPNFWTLCDEVQFYLTLVGTLVVSRALRVRYGTRINRAFHVLAFGTLFVVSVHQPLNSRGLAFDRWWEFFIGALAWWTVAGIVRWPVLAVTLAAAVVRLDQQMVVAVLVTGICMLSATSLSFDSAFRWRPLQYLGAISYSLYLFHPSVTWRVVSLARRTAGPSMPLSVGVFTWIAAVGSAVIVAAACRRFIERPAQRAGQRVWLPMESAQQPSGKPAPEPPGLRPRERRAPLHTRTSEAPTPSGFSSY